MEELVSFLAKSLTATPDDVNVNKVEEDNQDVFEVTVADGELGQLIGRQGRTARAMRTVVRAASSKVGRHAQVEIVD